jgi:hypothetical protein
MVTRVRGALSISSIRVEFANDLLVQIVSGLCAQDQPLRQFTAGVKPPGSHISTGSQVSAPSSWRQTMTAPWLPNEKSVTGVIDSKSAFGIHAKSMLATTPSIITERVLSRGSNHTSVAVCTARSTTAFVDFLQKQRYGFFQVNPQTSHGSVTPKLLNIAANSTGRSATTTRPSGRM